MSEAQGFEKIHIDNGSARRHDGIDHAIFDHIDIHLHTTCRTGAAGQGQNIGATVILYHAQEYIRRRRRVPR